MSTTAEGLEKLTDPNMHAVVGDRGAKSLKSSVIVAN